MDSNLLKAVKLLEENGFTVQTAKEMVACNNTARRSCEAIKLIIVPKFSKKPEQSQDN